jgi:lysophospholipase L1-like esterase
VDVDGTRKVDHKTPYNSVDTKSPTGWSAGYLATPLFGLANAAHTVVMTNHQDVPTSSLQAFDSLGVIDRTYLPQVVVNRGVKFDPARPPSGGTNADVDTFRGYFDEMVAEISAEAPWMLPAISYFDPLDYGWDPAAMIGSDNLHPNDLGHATLADALTAHLASLPFRAGMNK